MVCAYKWERRDKTTQVVLFRNFMLPEDPDLYRFPGLQALPVDKKKAVAAAQ
jgi:hypothetical protein